MTTSAPRAPAPPLPNLATRLSLLSASALLLLALIWGLSIPVTKLGLVSMPPMTLTALRFAIAVPFLFLIALGRHRMPPRAAPKVAAPGLLGIGIGQVYDRKSVLEGTSVSVRVDLGGRRIIKKKKRQHI